MLDDALVQQQECQHHYDTGRVSILVVLDDAPVPMAGNGFGISGDSLNPCCAGQCSSTFVAVGDRKQAIKS